MDLINIGKFDFVVTALLVAAIFIASFIMDNGVLFATDAIAAFVLSIVNYNRMMIYVEKNAF